MAKFYGVIGYVLTVEDPEAPSSYIFQTEEREYSGDVTRNLSKYESGGQVVDDFNISNTISIVADPFAFQNFQAMKYIEYMGAKWKIRNAEVQYPRIILNIGGVWNGDEEEEPP